MVVEESLDASDLGTRKPSVALQSDGVQPELRQLVIVLNMNMRRLITISCVKKEPVWSDSENGWHYPSFIAFFFVGKESERFVRILTVRIKTPNGPPQQPRPNCSLSRLLRTARGPRSAWRRELGGVILLGESPLLLRFFVLSGVSTLLILVAHSALAEALPS